MTRTALCLALVGVLMSMAWPAVAADELRLSSDGTHWSSNLQEPLFDPGCRWVPGDSETGSFYVRNQASSAGDLTIDVRDEHGDRDLSADLSFRARAGGGGWIDVERDGTSHVLNTSALPAGQSVRVDLSASFNRASTNRTQTKAVGFRFRVTLSDAQGGSGVLPATGSGVEPWMLWIGAIMIGSGLALVARRRERGEVGADV